MVMQAMRYGASNKFLKTALFGILLLATAGLMLTGGGNTFGGGVSRNDVAKIGKETVSLASFDRGVRRSLSRIGIQPKDAYKLGYMDQFLGNEIRMRLMAIAAQDDGILIDRKRIAGQVRSMIQPMVKEGQNPEEVLKMVLMNQGMSERELVESMEREMAGNLLAGTIQGGFAVSSEEMLKDFYRRDRETRDAQYAVFPDKDSGEIAPPPEKDIAAMYEAGKEEFAIPETRVLQIIKVKDDELKKTLKISDEEVQQSYESAKDSYSAPASHTVDQSLFDGEDEAKKVYEAVKGGKSMEQAVKEVTGKVIAYIGERDYEDAQIPEEIKEPVMKAKAGEMVGPLKTAIGWQVLKVKKVFAGGTKSFESVKDEIKKDLFETRLSDAKYDLANEVDDLLASGASLEDIVKQVDVETAETPAVNQYGQGPDGKDALKAYDKTGPAILNSGFKLHEGETSPVSEMGDGSFMAIRAKTVTPKTYKPFSEVKEELAKRWTDDQRRMENRLRVTSYVEQIKSGKKTLQEIAQERGVEVRSRTKLSRQDETPKPLGKDAAAMIFESEPGQAALVDAEDGAAIALVTGYQWPEKVDAQDESYKKYKDSFEKNLQSEALGVYMENAGRKYRVMINDRLLAQAYGTNEADADQ